MRRIAWVVLALLAASVGWAAWWLADHARPRHEAFVDRHGGEISAELEAPVTEPGGFISQGVHISSDSGLRVDARVLRPAMQDGPLPVLVLLGGHRTGRDAVALVGHPGDTVMVALDYPYYGTLELRSTASFFRAIRDIQQALLDTPPAASTVLDWLATQGWADTGRAELVGVSFGVPFVAVAGALDPRFRRVWFIHGGAGNRGWIEHNLRDRVPQRWLRPLLASLVHLLVYGNSFDTEEWVARIAPREVVVIGARDDERLPRHKVVNLYEAAGQPKELQWTEGGHIDPARPDIVRALLAIVRERLDESARPPAAPREPDVVESP